MKRNYNAIEICIFSFVVLIAAIPVWVPCAAWAVDRYYLTPARQIEIAWDIELPEDFEQVCHATSDDLLGRNSSYTVYEHREVITPFLNGFSFVKDVEIEGFVKGQMKELAVAQEYRISFESRYYYLQRKDGSDRIVVIYSPESGRCYFVEQFILDWDGGQKT